MTERLGMAVLASTLLTLLVQPSAAAEPGAIAVYRAAYEVEYNGRHVADAEFSVRSSGDGGYVFDSSTRARLLFRIAAPNPAIEHSEFRLVGDEITPIAFLFEDGSRSGDDNYRIAFDTAAGKAQVFTGDGSHDQEIAPGVLDRGSLQVAMMRDQARCLDPDSYDLIDDEGIDTYRVEKLDERMAETGIGDITTRRYRQQRAGSSRETIIWAAPEYAYLPVRIEQWRNGELQTALVLEELEGIEPAADNC